MIATSVGYDVVFVGHVLAVLASAVVLFSMRATARAIQEGHTDAVRLPRGRNWAARVVHLLLVTGLVLTLTGSRDVSPRHAWVLAGLSLYLIAAAILEGRALPLEQSLAAAGRQGTGLTREGAAKFQRAVEYVLVALTGAALAMLWQFG
jgi:hypothetical protein